MSIDSTERVPAPPGRQEPAPPLWIAPAAVLVGLFASIFVTLLVQLVGSSFGSPLSHPTPAVNLVADYLFDFAFVGSAVAFALFRGRMSLLQLGYLRISWRAGIGAVVLAGLGYYVVSFAYSALFAVKGNDKLPSELGVSHSTAAAAAAAVFVCVVAPIAEEFFFRGFLFGVLRQMRVTVAGHELGPWLAAVIVSILFGLAHTGSANPQFLIPLGFLGFVLCMVRWKTGSLYPCMALHSLNNTLALGVNELDWTVGVIVAVMVGSLLVIGLLTGPLAQSGTAD
jgi:membrane protease YdiL (CAAX protease family)